MHHQVKIVNSSLPGC